MTDRIGLAGLALLVSVPFLVPWHTSPIPTFYSEWWAVVFGLLASLALVGAKALPLPGATLLALVLALVAQLQVVFGITALPQIATIYFAYFLWAALLASAGRHLAEQVGLPRLTHILAAAVLVGALLAAVISLLQPVWNLPWFSARAGGPLGQANHFTSYLWLGLVSALYLHVAGALNRGVFWATATLLILTAVVVGQRSSFLYVLALLGIALLQARKWADSGQADLRHLALGIGLLFVLMQPLALWLPMLGEGDAKPPPALRAVQQAEGPSIRLQLWRLGLEGIAAAPLLGNGVGSYPTLALTHAEQLPAEDNPGPAESAHNLFIDLGVEMGMPAALLVLAAAGLWLWRLWKSPLDSEAGWAIGICAILGLHSLIEYPLNHSYFLGLLAVVAGAWGVGRHFGQRLAPVVLSIGLLVWGCLPLAEFRRDYGLLEMALALGKQPTGLPLAKAALIRIPSGSLLSPWVNTTACVSLDPLRVPVVDGLAVCRTAMRFAPTIESGIHTAVLQWRNNDVASARDTLRRVQRAFHAQADSTGTLLAKLAERDARVGEFVSP